MKTSALQEVLILLVGAGICVFLLASPWVTCANRAKMMGFPYDYSWFQGCMIQPKPGVWIPLANYRVL